MKPRTTTVLALLTISVGIVMNGSLNPAIAGTNALFGQSCMTNPAVSSAGDSGGGTLRQAVADACAGSTITFKVTGTIPLSSGQITIDKDLTIQGPGADALTVQNTAARSTTSRIFYVNPGVTATIAGLTISGGDIYAQSSIADNGGGIYNAGNLTVTGSIITNNQVLSPGIPVGLTLGGGISNVRSATLTVVNSTISNNYVFGVGGGIANFGTVNIDSSTISANAATHDGGGIYTAGAVNITNSTISHNGTGVFGKGGGGIFQNGGTVKLTNSTVSGNASASADTLGGGGGIYTFEGTLTLTSTTITNNGVRTSCDFVPCSMGTGGGIYKEFGSTVNSRNSILAGNENIDMRGTLTSQGYNLIGLIPYPITGDTTGNILNQNPLLVPLADNGGPTQTHALMPNSPAIDAGDSSGSTTDQRGAFRSANQPPPNVSDGSDIGAFELGPETTITAGPTDPSNSSSPSFSFVGADPFEIGVVAFECNLDGSGFTACSSPLTYASLSDGSHTFVVRALDNAGNRDGTPPSLTWTIDTAPPDTTLESSPSNPSGVNAPFSFSGTDTGTGVTGFACDLDGGGFSACASPRIYYGLTQGSHTVRVRAIDRAGNVDPTPPSFTWNVDPLLCAANPAVTNNSDIGAGSLRLAVADVCAGGMVTFDVTGTIPLSSGPITLDRNLTIQGPGAGVLAVQNVAAQSASSRVFVVNVGVTATIAGLTVSGGNVLGNGGGIVIADRAALTVNDSTISNNRASNNGGGIYNHFGTLTVNNSTISNNYSRFSGGGIHNLRLLPTDGMVTITNSTISNNEAVGDLDRGGGGLYNESGAMMLTNSTVSGNRTIRISGVGVPANGGGIYTIGGTLTLTNTTITNNSVADGGFGGGICGIAGTMNSRNSIIAGNGLDFVGIVTSQGYNLIGSPGGPITGNTTGNILNQNALLAPLADNGGPTQTHALLAGSPAIDAGDSSGSTTDQRGSSRPADQPPANVSDGADIGAFELGPVVDSNTPPSAANDAYNVNEDTTLNVPAPGVVGNDTDGEHDSLTTLLQTSPAHAAAFNLNADGSFSYTPTANFNGTDSFTYTAWDGSVASTAATVTITVTAVTDPVVLSGVPASATINELVLYGFTATASSVDSASFTFSLVGAPAGAAINPSTGAVSWTPSEAQGPGTYPFTVHVSDGVSNAEASISVTVNEVNSAPTLALIANKTVDELTVLSVTASGSDSDAPANSLTYSLDTGVPSGMTINPTSGAISWTPTAAQGPGDYAVTVRVTDNGSPNLSGTTTFSVHVNNVNTAPNLAPLGDSTIDEQVAFSFNASATDADLPAETLTFSLVGAPSGASINSSTGAFSWTPTEAQGPQSYSFAVKVTDSGSPALSDQEQITITVREINRPPVLTAISNQTGAWGNVFGFTAGATDPDIPANALTFSVIGGPTGAAIDSATGAFSWSPTAGQLGSHTFTVRVTDNGSPVLYDEKSVTLTVGKRPTMLVYTGDGAEQYSDQQALSATLVDAGGGAMNGMPLSGKTVGFAIGTQTTSTVTNASGAAANLILTQNPSLVYTVDSNFAGDSAYLAASDSDPFDITPEDARAYYTGALFASTASAASSTATVTLSATIRDITAETGDASYDAFAGDIRNATVTFINRDTNTVIASNLPVGLVSAGDLRVGTVVYNWNVNLGNADSTDVTIGIIVGNYYTRNAATENTLVTVSKPLGTNFITGGGSIVLQNSAGSNAGASGLKSNFGFSVKYNSSGKNLQGTANVIVRAAAGQVYQIKGNSMTSLSADNSNPLARTAVFNGKANITDITDPLNPIAVGGNMTLQMNMTDHGEPGNTDTIGITVWDNAGGLKFASSWNGTRTVEQALDGGNVIVR